MSLLRPKDDTQPWKGRYYPYDLVKELCIAVGVIALLAVLLTVLFSSPDDKPSTIAPVVARTAGQLRHHGGQGARRHQRHRRIRPALQPQLGQRAALPLPAPAALARRQPSDRHAEDYVVRPLETVPNDPALTERARRIQGRARNAEKGMGRSLRQAARRICDGGGRKEDAAEHGVGEHEHRRRDGQGQRTPARCRR